MTPKTLTCHINVFLRIAVLSSEWQASWGFTLSCYSPVQMLQMSSSHLERSQALGQWFSAVKDAKACRGSNFRILGQTRDTPMKGHDTDLVTKRHDRLLLPSWFHVVRCRHESVMSATCFVWVYKISLTFGMQIRMPSLPHFPHGFALQLARGRLRSCHLMAAGRNLISPLSKASII